MINNSIFRFTVFSLFMLTITNLSAISFDEALKDIPAEAVEALEATGEINIEEGHAHAR